MKWKMVLTLGKKMKKEKKGDFDVDALLFAVLGKEETQEHMVGEKSVNAFFTKKKPQRILWFLPKASFLG